MSRVLTSIVFLVVFSTATARADDSYPIGAILPLSGDFASGGQACLNGMKLAESKLKTQSPGVVTVVGEDNAGSVASTVTAYKKLRSQNKLKAVIVWEDSAGLALAPLTEPEGVVLVSTSGDRAIVDGRKHAFLYWLTLDTETEAIIGESTRRGYKRIARVITQHPGPIFMKGEFDRLNHGRLTIVSDQEVLAESRDFRTQLARIKQAGEVDAIVAFLWSGQIGLFAKQAHAMGIRAPFVGSDIYEDENELNLSDGALNGSWFPQIADPQPEFSTEYEAAFPGASIYSAGNCYDAVMLIAEARKAGRDVSEFLANVKDFPGALGRVSSNGDHRFTFPWLIREIREGKFQTAGQ